MNKKEFSINYISKWNTSTGTHYNQTINLTHKTFDKLLDTLEVEKILNTKDSYYNSYLKTPLIYEKNIVFMNLIQKNFFNKYLKLKLKDRNTCFCII